MSELKARAALLLGAGLMSLVGRDRFYQMAQNGSRIASAFCEGHAGRVGLNYSIFSAEKDRDRLTAIAAQRYSDESLHGFGDADYSRRSDGKPLLQQQRALILHPVFRAMDTDNPSSVMEIGTGNGDVIAHVARNYPKTQFTGVDFFTSVAQSKHHAPNLKFISGYALDILEAGVISPDLVFATSTFCLAAPKEFARYLSAMRSVRRIVISDPVTSGHRHDQSDLKPRSMHMDMEMWWHNYRGYLTDAGYRIESAQTVQYAYASKIADVFIISAKR